MKRKLKAKKKIPFNPVTEKDRNRTFFAWLPVRIREEVRWMERVTIHERLIGVMTEDPEWIKIGFVDLTDEQFCKFYSSYTGEEIDHVGQVKMHKFDGWELKELLEKFKKWKSWNTLNNSHQSL